MMRISILFLFFWVFLNPSANAQKVSLKQLKCLVDSIDGYSLLYKKNLSLGSNGSPILEPPHYSIDVKKLAKNFIKNKRHAIILTEDKFFIVDFSKKVIVEKQNHYLIFKSMKLKGVSYWEYAIKDTPPTTVPFFKFGLFNATVVDDTYHQVIQEIFKLMNK